MPLSDRCYVCVWGGAALCRYGSEAIFRIQKKKELGGGGGGGGGGCTIA